MSYDNNDDLLTGDQYDIISFVVRDYFYEIFILFPYYTQQQYKQLFNNIIKNKLSSSETEIINSHQHRQAQQALQGLLKLWDSPESLNAPFKCSPQKMHTAIEQCLNNIMNGTDDEYTLESFRTPQFAQKLTDKEKFDQFKYAYMKDYNSSFWSAPWSTMKWLLKNEKITTFKEVEEYAQKHPSRRTARILKNLFENIQTNAATSCCSVL